ncbi:hypothetical protein COU37_01220 [Candidatus Micrarchaeota archaeon CG10_big_fil_rev_8_21_14_0_10_45_29]|nr:MAG: hypothetical protein COU37_01220 [Candidatus Micrarchaeota archaeon CG10_big_fil_rev_8_21_14_0_10_45_29]
MDEKIGRKKILKEGKAEILVLHSGMRQRFEFKVVREKIGDIVVPFLKVERNVNAGELFRVANEMDLPVWGVAGKFFPKGKMAADFAGL